MSSQSLRPILFSLSLLSLASLVFPQGLPRRIVSDDFTGNRQEATPVTASNKTKGGNTTSPPLRQRPIRRTYRLASQPATRTRPSSTTAIAQLGITIWRLRPADSNDSAGRALIREKGKSSGWMAERVEGDTTFREGDHVRISVESPRPGYLYVVDRDLFADGTTGGAMLIYPWSDSDSHLVFRMEGDK